MCIMKTTLLTLAGLLFISSAPLIAQDVAPDVVGDNLFSPDLLRKHHEALSITEEQKTWFQQEFERSQQRVAELSEKLQREKSALGPLLKKERIDEAAVLAQSDKALELDREIKRAQLALLIRIKNKLTPEQQAKLTEIRAHGVVLQEKLRRAQEIAKRWQAEGKSLSQLEDLKRELEPLVREGKVKEAEAVLDKALKILEAK